MPCPPAADAIWGIPLPASTAITGSIGAVIGGVLTLLGNLFVQRLIRNRERGAELRRAYADFDAAATTLLLNFHNASLARDEWTEFKYKGPSGGEGTKEQEREFLLKRLDALEAERQATMARLTDARSRLAIGETDAKRREEAEDFYNRVVYVEPKPGPDGQPFPPSPNNRIAIAAIQAQTKEWLGRVGRALG